MCTGTATKNHDKPSVYFVPCQDTGQPYSHPDASVINAAAAPAVPLSRLWSATPASSLHKPQRALLRNKRCQQRDRVESSDLSACLGRWKGARYLRKPKGTGTGIAKAVAERAAEMELRTAAGSRFEQPHILASCLNNEPDALPSVTVRARY